MDPTTNRNTYWAYTLVDELARAGLSAVCIAPGSRSTPLALAFADSQTPVYIHPDERGVAYFALGLAQASGRTAAILCTSGTAAANFFPAIVEAHQAHIPLLVLTADRNHELRDSGANQTIDQVKMYGSFVRWAVDVAPPEANPSPATLQYLRTLADRALAATQGLPPGPVHLNLPFRKPLEPTPVPGDIPADLEARLPARPAGQPFVALTRGVLLPTPEQVDSLVEAISQARSGIIYCGPRCANDDLAQAGSFLTEVLALAHATGFPIFADALSGLRFHPSIKTAGEYIFGGYETFLRSLGPDAAPEIILQFGAVPTSKALADLLEMQPAISGESNQRQRFIVTDSGDWADDAFNTSRLLWADPAALCRAVCAGLAAHRRQPPTTGWRERFMHAEHLVWQIIDQMRQETFFEGAVLADLLDELSDGDGLFVASSLPVRHLDQFAHPRPVSLRVYANRGASGIDGTIASAIGAAASGVCRRMVLVIGDLAFLHDINSLLALRQYPQNLTIVLINNDGGGIFHRLPVASFEQDPERPLFQRLFLTPHGLQFEAAARLFELDYVRVSQRPALHRALRAALDQGGPHIIEVAGDAPHHEQVRAEIARRFTQEWQSLATPTAGLNDDILHPTPIPHPMERD